MKEGMGGKVKEEKKEDGNGMGLKRMMRMARWQQMDEGERMGRIRMDWRD